MTTLAPLALTALPPAAEQLRASVAAFLDEHTAHLDVARRARSWMGYDADFSRALAARGWVGLTLPREYGGAGSVPVRRVGGDDG